MAAAPNPRRRSSETSIRACCHAPKHARRTARSAPARPPPRRWSAGCRTRHARPPRPSRTGTGRSRGEQQQPSHVEPRRAPCLRPAPRPRPSGQQPERGERRGRAHRQVDEEDPPPARRADDRPAQQRPEHRGQQHRHADHAHHPSHPLRTRGLGQDGLPDGQDHPGAEPLQHPEGDQRTDGPRRPGEYRTRQEQQQRENPRPPGTEPLSRPSVSGMTVAKASM